MLPLDEPTATIEKDAELKVISSLFIFPDLTVTAIIRDLELSSLFVEVLQVKDKKIEEVNQLNMISDEVVGNNPEVITYC